MRGEEWMLEEVKRFLVRYLVGAGPAMGGSQECGW